MENTPECEKLPDLVLKADQPETFNAVMTMTTNTPAIDSEQRSDALSGEQSDAFSGIPEIFTNDLNEHMTTVPVATPENAFQSDQISNLVVIETVQLPPQTEPIGHDTVTTTDEGEATEALLALGKLPDMDLTNNGLGDDNADLMPIGGTNKMVDVNTVPIKLSTNDVDEAIENLPAENLIKPSPPAASSDQVDSTEEMKGKTPDSPDKNTQPRIKSILAPEDDDDVPVLPTKGELKVTEYGLKKSCISKRSYKCQKCGKKERSMHDLNEHHQKSHPPLLCSDCNKVFNIPSTFQLHLYEHQKKKIACETHGQTFSFKGQLEQHKIIHHTIKTHRCMAKKNCGRWFMRKADLTVHAATHDNNQYTCDKCENFSTNLQKYWKEDMKGHDEILPYEFFICEKRFLYWQQVS